MEDLLYANVNKRVPPLVHGGDEGGPPDIRRSNVYITSYHLITSEEYLCQSDP